MNAAACADCGALVERVHRHHPTGRAGGRPHHAGYTEVLCPGCHQATHRVWKAAGIDGPVPAPATLLRRIALGLDRRRIALTLAEMQALAVVLVEIADRVGGRS